MSPRKGPKLKKPEVKQFNVMSVFSLQNPSAVVAKVGGNKAAVSLRGAVHPLKNNVIVPGLVGTGSGTNVKGMSPLSSLSKCPSVDVKVLDHIEVISPSMRIQSSPLSLDEAPTNTSLPLERNRFITRRNEEVTLVRRSTLKNIIIADKWR